MNAQANKDLVLRFCQLISERQLDALFALLADDGSWSIPYRSDRFPYAGFRDKPAVREMISGFLGGFTEFSFSVSSITAEDDRVAVEAVSHGKGPGGAHYENVYSMQFTVRDGKVQTIREYFDPFQVLAYVEQLG